VNYLFFFGRDVQLRLLLKFVIAVCSKLPSARLKAVATKLEPKSKKVIYIFLWERLLSVLDNMK